MILIAITSKFVRTNLSLAVSLRAEGEVALLESPDGLGATAVSAYAEKCRELNFLRFSAARPCFAGRYAGSDAREHALAIRKVKNSTCGDDLIDVPVSDVADVEFAAGVFA